MPNDLDLKRSSFLDEMNEEQEDQLFSLMLAKRQKRTEQSIKRLYDVVEKQSELLSQELETVRLETKRQKEDAEMQLELERKRHRIEEARYGFVSLTDLGAGFQIPIGSATMGKLLKAAGIAKKQRGSTEPYMELVRRGYAKNVPYKDHVHYQWNPTKTIDKLDKWLEKNGYIDKFYRCDSQKELYGFINILFEKYVLATTSF